jgi:hypothetical protein
MLWAIAASGGLGVVLGLRFKMPSVVAASAVLVLAWLLAAPFLSWSLLMSAGIAFSTLCALQGGYLAGLFISCAWSRVSAWPLRPHLPEAATLRGSHALLADRASLR